MRIAARADEFENSRDITVQNLTLNNCNLTENPCGENIVFKNITLEGTSRKTICSDVVAARGTTSGSHHRPDAGGMLICGTELIIRSVTVPVSPGMALPLGLLTIQGKMIYQTTPAACGSSDYRARIPEIPGGLYLVRFAGQTVPVTVAR